MTVSSVAARVLFLNDGTTAARDHHAAQPVGGDTSRMDALFTAIFIKAMIDARSLSRYRESHCIKQLATVGLSLRKNNRPARVVRVRITVPLREPWCSDGTPMVHLRLEDIGSATVSSSCARQSCNC